MFIIIYLANSQLQSTPSAFRRTNSIFIFFHMCIIFSFFFQHANVYRSRSAGTSAENNEIRSRERDPLHRSHTNLELRHDSEYNKQILSLELFKQSISFLRALADEYNSKYLCLELKTYNLVLLQPVEEIHLRTVQFHCRVKAPLLPFHLFSPILSYFGTVS